MEKLSIGQVAARAGLRASALRYYEKVGLLSGPKRVNGRRVYGPDVLVNLRWIALAQEAGFSLPEIRKLLHGFPSSSSPSERWRELAGRKLKELDGLIARARSMQSLLRQGIRCRCRSLDECVPARNRSGRTRRAGRGRRPPGKGTAAI